MNSEQLYNTVIVYAGIRAQELPYNKYKLRMSKHLRALHHGLDDYYEVDLQNREILIQAFNEVIKEKFYEEHKDIKHISYRLH